MTPRLVALLRTAWGITLLGAPRSLLRAAGGPDQGPVPVLVARVLGVRQVGQGAATFLAPRRWMLRAGAGADALHAATGVALALSDRRWRRVGFCDAVLATTFMATGWGHSTDHRPDKASGPALRAVTSSTGGQP